MRGDCVVLHSLALFIFSLLTTGLLVARGILMPPPTAQASQEVPITATAAIMAKHCKTIRASECLRLCAVRSSRARGRSLEFALGHDTQFGSISIAVAAVHCVLICLRLCVDSPPVRGPQIRNGTSEAVGHRLPVSPQIYYWVLGLTCLEWHELVPDEVCPWGKLCMYVAVDHRLRIRPNRKGTLGMDFGLVKFVCISG